MASVLYTTRTVPFVYYMRIRVASDGKAGRDNEFALDFLELVPKSVFGTDGDGEMEDDL